MAVPDKTGKTLVQFNVKNGVYAVEGTPSTVKPFTFMNTFSKDRNVTVKNLYGDGEVQDSLISDRTITGAIGATARDLEFEKDIGFIQEDGGGGTDEIAVTSYKRVNFGFETEYKEKGKPSKVKKVWVLNTQITPPNESITQNQDDITESTFDYNYTGYGVNKKDSQGTAEYVDKNGKPIKVYTVSCMPDEEGYATFLDSVPVPKMAAGS